jgi:GNAT superfamily N-acetyltransferase
MTPAQARFAINPVIPAAQVADLREAVGWDRLDEDHPAAFAGYWATVGGFDPSGALVAWCAILSDGVRHAVLLDVIVHPAWQRRGVGRALVGRAIRHCLAHGVTIIHVDFLPAVAPFYERCGFRTGLGGIYDPSDNARQK